MDDIFLIFDGYFFCGALRRSISVGWEDQVEGQSRSASHPHTTNTQIIYIERHLDVPWTRESLSRALTMLIQEMAHAVFASFACKCDACSCPLALADGTGVTGYGPNWRKLGQHMQEELNRAFDQLGVPWCLGLENGGV